MPFFFFFSLDGEIKPEYTSTRSVYCSQPSPLGVSLPDFQKSLHSTLAGRAQALSNGIYPWSWMLLAPERGNSRFSAAGIQRQSHSWLILVGFPCSLLHQFSFRGSLGQFFFFSGSKSGAMGFGEQCHFSKE